MTGKSSGSGSAPRRSDRLLDREEQLRTAQEIAGFGIWEWDIPAGTMAWSRQLHTICGTDPETFEPSYQSYLEMVHPDDRERVDQAVRAALPAADDFQIDMRVIRPDGEIRLIETRARTTTDDDGKPVRVFGTARDVTEHRQAQEQAARAEVAIEIAHRLADLQRITEAALTHLSLDELLPELLERVCQTLHADDAAVFLLDDDGETLVLRAARGVAAGETGFRVAVGGGFTGRVISERRLIVVGERAWEHVATPALRDARIQTLIGVPLIVHGKVIGVLDVGSRAARVFAGDEVALLELAADRAALAIEHARIYERERGIAETLQRALLPDKVPDLGPMRAAVRYVPASAEIGGDWYDVIPLGAGRVGAVLGDVTGHGLEAAALMAQLRHSLRAYALEGLEPHEVANRLDRLVHSPHLEHLATLIYAVVAPDMTVAYVNAGHLPPLVVSSDGSATFLDGQGGVPIGCQTGGYVTERLTLEPGDTLVLFTDGLIERRGESIEDGLERLRAAAATAPADPADLADHLLRVLMPAGDGEDDIALLAICAERVPVRRA